MIDVFTVIWAALSVLILAALVYFVAKKKNWCRCVYLPVNFGGFRNRWVRRTAWRRI